MSEQKNQYINKTKVKKLGFSDAMIDKFLPEPIERCNPFYRCAAPMLCWDIEDVEKVMKTNEFKIELEKANKRREVAKKAVATKKKKTEHIFDEKIKKISVEKISIKKIRKWTLEEKEYYELCKGSCLNVRSADKETIERWMVNYIRHTLTDYDAELFETKGLVGKREGYFQYKEAVLNAIAQQYPMLEHECDKQITRLFELSCIDQF